MRNLTRVGVLALGLGLAGGLAPAPAAAQGQVGFEVWVGGGARPHYDAERYPGIAFERGLEDGYREGLDDARDRDRFDPVGEWRYRRGDSGYHPRYGPREYYRRDYREGFLAGYERGYRDAWGPRGRYDRRDRYGYPDRPATPPYPAYPGGGWRW